MPDLESPTARPATRRVDESAADVATLDAMGVIEQPPPPTYEGLFVEPDLPPPPEEPS
ncbi:hypothetical protein ACH4D4_05070 [Streptomyces pristinaespiralis]|uniref:hypothetical protein n=1 Tax=Streptomyces pristinaespiralis TaxID=38300 RepID=UPI00379D6007